MYVVLDRFAKLAQQLGAAADTLDTTKPTVSDPFNEHAYDMLGVHTPGSTFEMYGDDAGKLLKAGQSNYLPFNVHDATIGIQASDRSQLALWFAKSAPAHQLIRSPAAVETIIANGRQLLADDPGTLAEGTYVVHWQLAYDLKTPLKLPLSHAPMANNFRQNEGICYSPGAKFKSTRAAGAALQEMRSRWTISSPASGAVPPAPPRR